MREVVELDDGSLLHIFAKVGNAREIARLSSVCKRWRELRWSVSYLAFYFAAATQLELRRNEDIISSVLCRTKSKSPRSLKHLSVTLSCVHDAEAACHWLVWATGLAKLQIRANGPLTWGPNLWNTVAFMDTVEVFVVAGRFHSFLPSNDLTLGSLRHCNITNGRVPASLLHAMLAACPALEHLGVTFFSDASIRVASASLKKFQLFGVDQAFNVIIDAPKLASLWLGSMGARTAGKPSVQFVSKGLQELILRVPCVLNNCCDSVRDLTISGFWDVEDIANLLKLTPMVSELHLRSTPSTMMRMRIDNVLAPLGNLRNIHFGSSVMASLEGGVVNLGSLDAHLWPDESCRYSCETRLLRDLVEVHKVRSLVVHGADLIDHRTKAVKHSYNSCRGLFDLLLVYPGRVKLCLT